MYHATADIVLPTTALRANRGPRRPK